MNIALSTFAAWPKIVTGRVSFSAPCPCCGQDAAWEQIGRTGPDTYEIGCTCTSGVTGPGTEDVAPAA